MGGGAMLIENQETRVPALIRDLAQRISYGKLAQELGVSEEALGRWSSQKQFSSNEIWKLVRSASKYGFFDILPAHGVPPVSYNIAAPFNITAQPLGYGQELPRLSLRMRETQIAGCRVDFPLGLPASVLAANANWIEFYAARGFDILTYKTVRTRYRQEHRWPNWVFLENAPQIEDPSDPPVFVGQPGYWPEDPTKASMANSFGVPSLDPTWWKEDVRKAREFVREGHQVLIVSIVASVVSSPDDIAADFAKTAILAKEAGADIVEANYSCPNTPDDPGEIYQSPEKASRISKSIREALGNTPFLTKIGYLSKPLLRRFLELNAKYIDGVVGINTIGAEIIQKPNKVGTAQKILDYLKALNYIEKEPTFPGRPRAGVSGWAIRARAQEIALNLVELRKEIPGRSGKPLTILGVGGVLTPQDFFDRLAVGVDAVESCTGAFLNPYLGLEIRSRDGNIERTVELTAPAR
jgi:dihydroorotate dehydrogenase